MAIACIHAYRHLPFRDEIVCADLQQTIGVIRIESPRHVVVKFYWHFSESIFEMSNNPLLWHQVRSGKFVRLLFPKRSSITSANRAIPMHTLHVRMQPYMADLMGTSEALLGRILRLRHEDLFTLLVEHPHKYTTYSAGGTADHTQFRVEVRRSS